MTGPWHVFDPTFGVFFSSDGRLDAPAVSYHHLESFPELGATNVFYPKARGRLGWYYPPESYKSTGEMYQRAQPEYQQKLGSYELFAENNCGSVAYEGQAILTLPIRWSMAGRTQHRLGRVDGGSDDIIYQKNDAGVYDATSQYMLGDASGSLGPLFIRHRYIIDGVERGERWRLRIDWLSGASTENFRYTVYGGKVIERNVTDNRISIDIEARAKVIEIVSRSGDDKIMRFDAVSFTRLEPQSVP